MFTGLVRDIGTVISAAEKDGGRRIEIGTKIDLEKVPLGASIACSGVCLTVIEKSKNSFWIDASEETLRKTLIGKWRPGTKINIEPSLHLGDEIGGHFVFGHVDGTATIKEIVPEGNSTRLVIEAPADLSHFLAPKGSVSLDGVSLTVNAVQGQRFSVSIIPHTWQETTFQFLTVGDAVHIEADMLARYVQRMLGQAA